MKPRHKHLPKDPDVRRWDENLSRGSMITAEERPRRLGRFGLVTGLARALRRLRNGFTLS